MCVCMYVNMWYVCGVDVKHTHTRHRHYICLLLVFVLMSIHANICAFDVCSVCMWSETLN
jgi:hypothetical protein